MREVLFAHTPDFGAHILDIARHERTVLDHFPDECLVKITGFTESVDSGERP